MDLREGRMSSGPTGVLKEFVNNEQLNSIRKCQAILLNSLGHRILANFVVKIIKPKYPIKIFTDKTEAINWLLQQK